MVRHHRLTVPALIAALPARPHHDRPRDREQHGPDAAVLPELVEHESDQLPRQLDHRWARTQHTRRSRRDRIPRPGHHHRDRRGSTDPAGRLRVRDGCGRDPEPDEHGYHERRCCGIRIGRPCGRAAGFGDRGCAAPPVPPRHDRRFEHHHFLQLARHRPNRGRRHPAGRAPVPRRRRLATSPTSRPVTSPMRQPEARQRKSRRSAPSCRPTQTTSRSFRSG